MLVDIKKLEEQLQAPSDATVKEIYRFLANASLPEGITVRPTNHGYISRELRFEIDDRWYYSAVLNQKLSMKYSYNPGGTNP